MIHYRWYLCRYPNNFEFFFPKTSFSQDVYFFNREGAQGSVNKAMESDIIKVLIQGKQFKITEILEEKMGFFQEWKALSPHTNICVIQEKSVVTLQLWTTILGILQHQEYNIPRCPKVNSNQPRDYISSYLCQTFTKMSLSELNRLYTAAHFLKIENLKIAIAAFLATKVYIGPNEGDFQERMKANNVKENLTFQKQIAYKQNYPFMNM